MKLAIVIAAYNEAGNIGPLCQRLLTSLRADASIRFDLIFVVEGDDGTAAALRRLAAATPQIRIIEPTEKRGLGAAFRLGFAAVPDDADMVVTMDADLNHAPEEILGLVAGVAQGGADIVIGSRMVRGAVINGMPRWKSVLSRSVNTLVRQLFATSIRDQTSGFRIYKAGVIRDLKFRNDGFAFLPEILTLARGGGHSKSSRNRSDLNTAFTANRRCGCSVRRKAILCIFPPIARASAGSARKKLRPKQAKAAQVGWA